MIVKRFGCTAIHNKVLHKCIIHVVLNPHDYFFCGTQKVKFFAENNESEGLVKHNKSITAEVSLTRVLYSKSSEDK